MPERVELFKKISSFCMAHSIKFVIHNCTFCKYPCGYLFKDNKIFFDSGCDCINKKVIEKRTVSEVLESIDTYKEECFGLYKEIKKYESNIYI